MRTRRRQWATGLLLSAVLTSMLSAGGAALAAGFEQVEDFAGSGNPGRIDMFRYVPASLRPDPALIVVLHGCGQSARDFGAAGWFDLAESTGALLLLPQQRRRNSLSRCWNWFIGADGADNAEMQSILAMIARMRADYAVDGRRIFVAGLSAGGWLTSLLLAAHPELFRAGAIIAGGPAYCAFSRRPWWDPFGVSVAFWAWPAAFDCMDGVDLEPRDWARRVRANTGVDTFPRMPRLSIWHGSDDDKVGIANLEELVDQWSTLAGTDIDADGGGDLGVPGRLLQLTYAARDGGALVETVTVDGMGHVMPIDAAAGCGEPGSHVEDIGICAAALIGRFWQLRGAGPP